MATYTLLLMDSLHKEQIEDVSSFVGEDASGSFGIQSGHARMMTSLVFGLARFRCEGHSWQYLALPGAMLYFNDNQLSLSCRRYLRDDSYERISTALQEQLLAEEESLHIMKQSLRHMEEEMLKRMWEIGHESG